MTISRRFQCRVSLLVDDCRRSNHFETEPQSIGSRQESSAIKPLFHRSENSTSVIHIPLDIS
jgi:hypothetical protein